MVYLKFCWRAADCASPASSARITSFLPVDATPVRHPSPATCRPPPATRHPPPLPTRSRERWQKAPPPRPLVSRTAPRVLPGTERKRRGEKMNQKKKKKKRGALPSLAGPDCTAARGLMSPHSIMPAKKKERKLVRSTLVVVTRNTKSPRTPPRNLAAVRATQSPEKNAAGAPTSREIELAKLQSPNSPNFPSFHNHTRTTHPQHPRWGAFPVTTS